MGENRRGAQDTDKTTNGKKARTGDSGITRSDNGEGTTDKNKVDSKTKKRPKLGLWNVRGFAPEERKGVKITEQVSKPDLDIVGNQESWEKEGGEIGCKTWIGKTRIGHNSKNRGAGGVGFLVKECLCDIIEGIKDTEFDESIWIRYKGSAERNITS